MTESESTKDVPLLTSEEMSELLHTLFKTARDSDNLNLFGTEEACARGMIYAHFTTMWKALPDNSFLKTYIPQSIQEEIDEIGQRAVMKKLES